MIKEAIEFLLRHGYLVLFGFVLGEQIGLPVPALPVLLAVGALSASGQFSFATALAVAVIASVISDLLWYEMGLLRGHAVLKLVCRISLEPDSCVRSTENTFARYGARTLLFAKFVPGLNTVAPPLSGLAGLSRPGFLAWDGVGAFLYLGAMLGAGYLFSAQLEDIAGWAMRLGSGVLLLLIVGLVAYIVLKYTQRRRFLRKMRVARITAAELAGRLEAGEQVMVVDLRHPLELQVNPIRVPGALQMRPDELEARHREIPRDREIILYCT